MVAAAEAAGQTGRAAERIGGVDRDRARADY
jgi:hypothetical protein